MKGTPLHNILIGFGGLAVACLWLPRLGKSGAQQLLDVSGSEPTPKLNKKHTHIYTLSNYILSVSHPLKAKSVVPQRLAFPLMKPPVQIQLPHC